MTYGQTASQLRDSATWLLSRHRMHRRLAPRENADQLIVAMVRYRDATMAWCLQAISAAMPETDSVGASDVRPSPVHDLHNALRFEVAGAMRTGPPMAALLATSHDHPLVNVWQRAARIATLGEREVPAADRAQELTVAQCRAVVKDAADITRALVILDTRYQTIPGWETLRRPLGLGHTAEACSTHTGGQNLDYSVDQHGYRPPAGIIEGPALAGVAGVVQAQHNTVVDLAGFPNALNLRRILLSQAQLSHAASVRADPLDAGLGERFRDRTTVYRQLVRASRDVAGLIGAGGYAALESHNAATRLQRATSSDVPYPLMQQLDRLCTRADNQIAAIVEHGLRDKLYLAADPLHRLIDSSGTVHTTGPHWAPAPIAILDSDRLPGQLTILSLARQLRTPLLQPAPTIKSARSRAAFAAHIENPDHSIHGEPLR